MYINQCYNVSSENLDETAIWIILQCLFWWGELSVDGQKE